MNITLCVTALLLSFILHFIIQKIFIFYNRFDDINQRSSHKTLATRTGGVGIFMTLFILSTYYYFNTIELFDYSLFIPLGIMFIVGVYDDLYNADFKLKFLLQIIVAKILIDQGYVISNYYGFLGIYEVPWILAQLTTVFVFLVVVNSINFIDGIDALAITEVVKIILIIELTSAETTALLPIGILTIFSIIPLYYFNLKKEKKIFLGDGGSMFLGTLVMIYLLVLLGDNYTFRNTTNINKTFFAIVLLAFPLIDLLRVFVIRISNGKSPFHPDNNHLHHLLHKRNVPAIINVATIQLISISLILITLYFF